jgi:hypothetical protein
MTVTIFDKLVQRFGILGFISFFLVFVSIFTLQSALPVMFFGTCFFCFGLLMVLPNTTVVKSGGILTPLIGVIMVLMGGGVLLFGASLAIFMDPYSVFAYVVIVVFILIPKGFFKSVQASAINFSSDKISVSKKDGSSVSYYAKDVKNITLLEGLNTITIVTDKETITYESDYSFERLNAGLDLFKFNLKKSLVGSAKGKSLEEILKVPIDPKNFEVKINRDSEGYSRELFYIKDYDQWLDPSTPYVLSYSYQNPDKAQATFDFKIKPFTFIKAIFWLGLLFTILFVGLIFIPHNQVPSNYFNSGASSYSSSPPGYLDGILSDCLKIDPWINTCTGGMFSNESISQKGILENVSKRFVPTVDLCLVVDSNSLVYTNGIVSPKSNNTSGYYFESICMPGNYYVQNDDFLRSKGYDINFEKLAEIKSKCTQIQSCFGSEKICCMGIFR